MIEKPFLYGNIKLDETALRSAFLYNLNKIHPVLQHLVEHLPGLANETCYGDLQNAIQELLSEVIIHLNRINTIFSQLKTVPDNKKSLAQTRILEILLPDREEYLSDHLSKDLFLVFHIQKVLNIKRNYFYILKSISSSLNNIDIKKYLQHCYDECEDNQLMFRLIAKEYMESSINTFLS